MDPRVTGAGVAMAIGMMVLLPTFNALNNSYVTDVAPPAWLAKLIDPENLPEDFQPPDDMKIPEDMELPEDFEPPPGWEIPPDYDGPIPEGGCDGIPPLVREIEDWRRSGSISANAPSGGEWVWELPETTAGFELYVNFTDWQARSVRVQLENETDELIDESEQGDSTTGLLVAPQPVPLSEFAYTTPMDQLFPAPGPYTLTLTIEFPISGSYTTEGRYAVPCGGLLE